MCAYIQPSLSSSVDLWSLLASMVEALPVESSPMSSMFITSWTICLMVFIKWGLRRAILFALSSGCFVHRFSVSRTCASHLRDSIVGILCGDVCLSCHSVSMMSSDSLLRGSCVSQQLHSLVSLSDQRGVWMLLFTAQPFSTSFWDVLSVSWVSSRSVMISLRAFFALSNFHLALLFALSTWAIYLTALSAQTCSQAAIIGSLMVILLELLWLKLENSELCRSSDAPWCEYCLCDALPDSDPLPSSNGKLFRLMPLLRDIGIACCGTSALLGLGSSPLITLVGLWPRGSLSFVDGTRMMGSTTSPSTSSAPSDSTSATLPSEYSQKWSGDRAALVALNIKVALSE